MCASWHSYGPLDKISEYSGLSFEYVYADTYADSIRMLQEGQADILGCYLDSEKADSSGDFIPTNPYMSINNILVKNKSIDFPSGSAVAGLQEGRIPPGNLTTERLQYLHDVRNGLAAANDGQIDVYYGLAASIEQELQKHRYLNLVPLALFSYDTDVTFAINRPAPPELLTILNKSIAGIPEDDRNLLSNRNMISSGYSSLSVTKLIYANPLAFVIIFCVFLLMVVLFILLHIRNHVKTTLMQSELEKIELKNRSRSTFLSRMSHEIRTPMNTIVGLATLTCMEDNLSPAVEDNLKKLLSSSQYLLSNAVKFTLSGGRVSLKIEETGSTDQAASFSFSVSDNGIGIEEDQQKRIFDSFEQLGDGNAKSTGTVPKLT